MGSPNTLKMGELFTDLIEGPHGRSEAQRGQEPARAGGLASGAPGFGRRAPEPALFPSGLRSASL